MVGDDSDVDDRRGWGTTTMLIIEGDKGGSNIENHYYEIGGVELRQ